MASYYLSGYTPPANITSASAVKSMQNYLNSQGANLAADGIWGPKTEAAYAAMTGSAQQTPAQQYAAGLGGYMESIRSLIDVPQISYTPKSSAALQSEIDAALRPGLELAMAQRKEQTLTNRAEIDVDAYSRGLGSSTYVTDVKARQMNAEADDISAMQANYAAAVASALLDAVERENARALQVQQYNLEQQSAANKLAFSAAEASYKNALSTTAAPKKSGKSGSSSSKAGGSGTFSAHEIYAFLDSATPAERAGYYYGTSTANKAMRKTIISAIGAANYKEAQAVFPAK